MYVKTNKLRAINNACSLFLDPQSVQTKANRQFMNAFLFQSHSLVLADVYKWANLSGKMKIRVCLFFPIETWARLHVIQLHHTFLRKFVRSSDNCCVLGVFSSNMELQRYDQRDVGFVSVIVKQCSTFRTAKININWNCFLLCIIFDLNL